MFNTGIRELLQALPELEGIEESYVYRLLSGAWLEVVERGELDEPEIGEAPRGTELRRLAMALQVDAVLRGDLASQIGKASAFVAAEALEIAREVDGLDGDVEFEQVTMALLYLISGYDANAAVAVRSLEIDAERRPGERYALECVVAFLRGERMPVLDAEEDLDAEEEEDGGLLFERVEEALMLRIGGIISDFARWVRDPEVADEGDVDELLELADQLRLDEEDVPIGAHARPQHFARVLYAALSEARERALRSLSRPAGEPDTYSRFLKRRCASQPLVWPAALDYAARALPGPQMSAVVSVPTGAGKSAVADLAIQHSIGRGWVLYLAPTNALVGQIRRQLRRDHPGVGVREFFGGAEYTTMAGEALDEIESGEVLVMTPEKCSLALRRSPGAFSDLSLLVFDEAHTLGDKGGRGVLGELVVAEVLVRAEKAVVLLMSALIENPDLLAGWLGAAQGREAVDITEPWRPTRTLRAVVGVDREAALELGQDPARRLSKMSQRRKRVKFTAPLSVLAGLRGAWSTSDRDDYSLHRIGADTEMAVFRRKDGSVAIDEDSAKTRPMVEAVGQLLGGRGQKVMAFLPRSRHDCFVAALSLQGFGETELEPAVDALLEVADAELGVRSLLTDALRKGVGVHTSALLATEQRASELSFVDGGTRVLFATSTLAQGLNLPATTVIVGGTRIGYTPDQSAEDEQRQQRSQLLNAIGRAGRARVAMRSLALVVPNEPPLLDEETVVDVVLPGAKFLAEEDASTPIISELRPLLSRIEGNEVDPDDLWREDQNILAYLAPAEGEAETPSILRSSLGAFQLGLRDQAEALAGTIGELGRHGVASVAGPSWSAEAGRRGGIVLPVAGRFGAFVVERMGREPTPATTEEWLVVLIGAISIVPPEELGLLLEKRAFGATVLADLWSEDDEQRRQALVALGEIVSLWISGRPFSVIGGAAHGGGVIDDPGRGQQSPLPRTIRLVEQGFVFGLTRAAGLLAATVDVGTENGAFEAPDDPAREQLGRLAVVLRLGANDPKALALMRAGARPRAIGHLLAQHLSPAETGLGEDGLRAWAAMELRDLAENFQEVGFSEEERRLIASFLIAREAS
jgi:hypothetical protein